MASDSNGSSSEAESSGGQDSSVSQPADSQPSGTTHEGQADDDKSSLFSYVREAHSKAPEIGYGHRWYDRPYNVLFWLRRSWRRRMLPDALLRRCLYGINYLLQFYTHDVNKAWSKNDEMRNLSVPQDEHVTIPDLWTIELFPPSEFKTLAQSISRNSWDSQRLSFEYGQDKQDQLKRTRDSNGQSWWRLVSISDPAAPFTYPAGSTEKLPWPFSGIELTAIQVGAGLTAVVAHFQITPEASYSVDEVWHQMHEPQLIRRRGKLPKAEDRLFSGYRATQESRRALHDAARQWINRRCPGFFTRNNEPHPLIDMLLLEQHDPVRGERGERVFMDALRAIGLTEDTRYRTSPELPNIRLSRVETSLCPTLSTRTWTLWGNRSVLVESHDLRFYGSSDTRAIGHAVDQRIAEFFVLLSISDFIEVTEKQYSILRDTARARHGDFKARDVRRLRTSFLTLSLDTSSVAQDVTKLWNNERRRSEDVCFVLDLAPWLVAAYEEHERPRFTPIDMNNELRANQVDQLEQIVQADQSYRSILSTVASLGASIDTFKIGRIALLIAFASLLVAVVTLILTRESAEPAGSAEPVTTVEVTQSRGVSESPRFIRLSNSYLIKGDFSYSVESGADPVR
ncbi:hypothetical protein LY41_002789 [Prauserella halophila]|nr:hypothetical protein [Prauserella halophila]